MITVAIIEDHALVREGLTKLLSSYDDIDVVGTARDCVEGIDLVNRVRPRVLLVDIAMPKMDGISAIPKLKASWDNMQVLMLSVHDEPEYAHAAQQQGACGLISKTASADELHAGIIAASRGDYPPTVRPITSRERQVLVLINQGKTNKQIAQSLGINVKTVEHHCHHLSEKLSISSRAGLVAYASRIGLKEN